MKTLKIKKMCAACNGRYNHNSSNACTVCFGFGEITEIIENIIEYKEIEKYHEFQNRVTIL